MLSPVTEAAGAGVGDGDGVSLGTGVAVGVAVAGGVGVAVGAIVAAVVGADVAVGGAMVADGAVAGVLIAVVLWAPGAVVDPPQPASTSAQKARTSQIRVFMVNYPPTDQEKAARERWHDRGLLTYSSPPAPVLRRQSAWASMSGSVFASACGRASRSASASASTWVYNLVSWLPLQP